MTRFNIGAVVCATFMCGVSMPAMAQSQSAAPDGTSARSDGEAVLSIDDIVVTARKRSERLQDVPVAITAVQAAALASQGAVDIQSVAAVTPGLFYQSIEPSRPNIYLRGIGSRTFDSGSESSVGTFIDGVYIGRFGGQIASLVGVERIEVLKGPQGALFGRNTIGGAISVTTKAPSSEFEGDVSASYNRQSHFDSDGFRGTALLTGPLTKDGAVRALIAGGYSDDDGHVLAINDGRRYNGLKATTLRGRLAFDASDTLTIDLAGDYLRTRNRLGFQSDDVDGQRPEQLLVTPGLSSPVPSDPYRITQNPVSNNLVEAGGAALTVNNDGDRVAITSITAYRKGSQRSDSDIDGTLFDSVTNPVRESSHQFSQELRFTSVPGGALTFGDRLQWIVGGYYYSEDADRTDSLRLGPDNVVVAFFAGGIPVNNIFRVKVRTRSFALFGQASVSLAENLTLDLGLRYSNDRKRAVSSADANINLPIFVPANFTVRPRGSWSSLDPSVTLSYRPSRDVLLFASYTSGFKSGAFQLQPYVPEVASVVVDPEELNAYQGGVKADLLDRRLRINAAAFYYDYKNIQLPRIDIPPGGQIPIIFLSNAATSTVKGFEIEGFGILSDNLRIEYGYSYLDAKFKKYIFNSTLDFSGNRLPRAPRHTLSLTGVVTAPISSGEIELRGSMNYVSKFSFEPDNALRDPGTNEPGRTLFDASLGVSFDNGLSLSVWGRNLTDHAYRSSVLNISGYRLDNVWAQRRTVGVTIGSKF